jgi:hypothetical protein
MKTSVYVSPGDVYLVIYLAVFAAWVFLQLRRLR